MNVFSYGNRWKRTRYEIGGGVGISGFMGDLGGAQGVGPGFKRYIADYDYQSTRFSFSGFMRYRITRSLAAKTSLTFGYLSGDDKYSGEPAREVRNLNFRSFVAEQALTFEWFVLKEKNSRRWSRKRRRKTLSFNPSVYLFTGVGGFLFKPYGQYENEWYDLYKIGTEGQNVPGAGGAEPYRLYQVCFPAGGGVTFGLNRKTSVGVELGYRFTMTDYVDDVGGKYGDNLLLMQTHGKEAGFLADNHVSDVVFTQEMLDGEYSAYKDYYQPGDRVPYNEGKSYRGGGKNDMYMFLMVTFQYKLRTTRRGLPKF